jgi:hypothetical protein
MLNDQGVRMHNDLLDEQSDDLLALRYIQSLGRALQSSQEMLDRSIKLRQAVVFQGLQRQPFQFLFHGRLSASQFRRSAP